MRAARGAPAHTALARKGAASVVEREPDVPTEYICPISLTIMVDPVIAADGYSYERQNIANWMISQEGREGMEGMKTTSPTTNEELEHSFLIPNKNLKILIDDFRRTHGYVSGEDASAAGIRNSPAKKQQRVASPTPELIQPTASATRDTPEERERKALQDQIDQQLAEIQSMIWNLPTTTTKPVSPARETKTSVAPTVVTPSQTPSTPTKESNVNAWTTVVQSKKNATSAPPAAALAEKGPKSSPKKAAAAAAAREAAATASAAAEKKEATVTKAFLCPSSRVRYVIGTKGVILKRLMTQSGATITTATSDVVAAGKTGNETSENAQVFSIKGTKDAVHKAEELIASVIADGAKALST